MEPVTTTLAAAFASYEIFCLTQSAALTTNLTASAVASKAGEIRHRLAGKSTRLLENHDLTRLLGHALQLSLRQAAETLPDTSDDKDRKRLRHLASDTRTLFPSLSKHRAFDSLAEDGLATLLSEVTRHDSTTFAKIVSDETWISTLTAANEDAWAGLTPPARKHALHNIRTTTPKAVVELLKHDAQNSGKAYPAFLIQAQLVLLDNQAVIGVKLDALYRDVKRVANYIVPTNETGECYCSLLERIGGVYGQLESVRDQLNRIEEYNIPRPSLAAPVAKKSWRPGDRGNPFVYTNDRVDFIGRDYETMLLISRFLWTPPGGRNDKPITWWAWLGPAGIGKSRLALELAQEAQRYGWDAGFLSRDNPFDDWEKWEPARDTLIVIDYVAERAAAVSRIIQRIHEHRSDWLQDRQRRVRFLLLERDTLASWLKKFTEDGVVADLGFIAPPDPDNAARLEALRINQSDPVWRLRELGPDTLWAIATAIFDQHTVEPPDQEKFLEVLRRVAVNRETPRALTTMILADVVAERGLDMVQYWGGNDLLRYVIIQEKKHWAPLPGRSGAGPVVTRYHLNALAYATIIERFLDPADPPDEISDLLPGISPKDRPALELLARFAGDPPIDDSNSDAMASPRGVLPGLKPDLLGEYFVLARLAGEDAVLIQRDDEAENPTTVQRATRRLLRAAWRERPDQAKAFVLRCVRDHFDHPETPGLWEAAYFDPTPEDPGGEEGFGLLNEWGRLVGELSFRLINEADDRSLANDLMRDWEVRFRAKPCPGLIETAVQISSVFVWRNKFDPARVFAVAAQEAFECCEESDLHIANLMGRLGATFYKLDDLGEAKKLAEQVLSIQREHLGDDHLDVAVTMFNLAVVADRLGDSNTARGLKEQVLSIRREHLGDDHLDVASTMHSLAVTLYSLNEFNLVRELEEQVLAIRRKHHGDDHLHVASAMKNLASTLVKLNDLRKAKELEEQSLFILRKNYGDDHLDVASAMCKLASTLNKLGNLYEVRELEEQALAIQRKHLDENHLDVVVATSNLASTLNQLGELDEAQDLHEQTLAFFKLLPSEEHIHVANSMSRLASVLRNQGNLDAAKKLIEQALKLYQHLEGEENSYVAYSMVQLASVMQDQGDLNGAKEIHTCALELYKKLLGDKNLAVAASMNHVGLVLQDQGDLSGARVLYESSLEMTKELLGKEAYGIDAIRYRLLRLSVLQEKIPKDRAVAEAQRLLRRLIGKVPAISRYPVGLGRFLRELGSDPCTVIDEMSDTQTVRRYAALLDSPKHPNA